MRRRVPRTLATLVAVALALPTAPAGAADAALTVRANVAQVGLGKTFTLAGALTPATRNAIITRQVWRDAKWQSTGTAKTDAGGAYAMTVKAPAWAEVLKLRVTAKVGGATVVSPTVRVDAVKNPTKATPVPSATPTPTASATPMPTPTPTVAATTGEAATKHEPLATAPALATTGDWDVTPANTTDTDVVDTLLDRNALTFNPTIAVSAVGPGGRILGTDIARYQHPASTLFPGGAPIDFTKMYGNGARFVFIKASDGHDLGHNNAEKWYAGDRTAAQAAGLYTGFYHFAYFPNSTNRDVIIADAYAQADKAVWRLASVGGYNTMDLPYALDIEEACVASSSSGACTKYVTKANATTWVLAWLQRVEEKTGRKPFVYSSPSFLQSYLERNTALRAYPLWVAHYGRTPDSPSNFPGMKDDGSCFIHAWTLSSCLPQWTIWQYTSSGKGTAYGTAGGSIDVNVFNGSSDAFLALTEGTWAPTTADYMPFGEATTMTLGPLSLAPANKTFTVSASVKRPAGTPAVAGTVTFVLTGDAAGVPPTTAQINALKKTVTRTTLGTWTLKVTGLPVGTWTGNVVFNDTSGVHASTSAPVTFTIPAPAATPSATPTPSASPSVSPAPVPTETATPAAG